MEQHSNIRHVTQPLEHVIEASSSSANNGGGYGAKYKLMTPAKLPISRSPCITIPPGLSPSSFLESPVLLSNIKAEPSPTTGSFFKPQLMEGSAPAAAFSFPTTISCCHSSKDGHSSSFEFEFQTGPGLSSGSSISAGLKHIRSEQLRQVQDQCLPQSIAQAPLLKSEILTSKESGLPDTAAVESEEITQRDQQNSSTQVPHSDPRDMASSVTSDRSSEDGFNWRKYGQKLVKGSEFPRSYYKCTYPNCEVKKIFKRSPDGHITEIVYKGSHDHPKPQPSRRFAPGALISIQEEKYDKDPTFNGQDDKFNTNGQTNNADLNGINGPSPQQTIDDGQDCAVAQSQNSNDDIDEEDPFSKRRRIDGSVDITPVIKSIREPRVVVQTVSEVDILEDGYRWRKYGQKVVRGNPNPRSYYKCTNAGCLVRKHVERAAHDPKAVITTYEGKHNHDVPTAKANTHEHYGHTPISGISRMISEDNDSVSLDLGVGNSIANSGMMDVQTPSISGCYGMVNGGMTMYGSRENRVSSRGFEMPPLNPTNQYPQTIGQILMGP